MPMATAESTKIAARAAQNRDELRKRALQVLLVSGDASKGVSQAGMRVFSFIFCSNAALFSSHAGAFGVSGKTTLFSSIRSLYKLCANHAV
jgi:hypothetical protein